jgi:sugar-specific transcriptional regulator TrmB
VSPEAIQSFLEGKEKEYIETLERERKHLTNTVHRLIKDRQRIMDQVKEIFSEIKE